MKTALRIALTFTVLVFFSGISFSQVASSTVPAKTTAKAVTAAPGKTVDASKSGACNNHDAKCAGAQSKNFVDKNGDGKCDNCGGTGKCAGTGNCGAKAQGCGSSCGKSQGKSSCCGQGQKHGTSCSKPCGTAPAQPNK